MDPVALTLAAVWTLATLALLFLLPGLALGRLVAPGAMSPGDRLGRAAGLSLLVTAGASAALIAMGLLRPTILIATLIGLTVLPLHASLPRRPALPRGRARRWWLAAAGPGAVALAFLLLPGWRAIAAGGTGPAPSWAEVVLAQAIAMAGRIPDELPAWGGAQPVAIGHLLATSHLAAALELLPGDLVLRLEAYRAALLAGGLLTATMLFRRWVSSVTALLGAVLLLATVMVSDAFGAWDPLAPGLVLALFGAWLVDRGVVERSRRLAAGAAVVGAGVLLAHPAAHLAWLAGIAGIVIARTFVAPGGGPEAAGGLGHRHRRRIGVRLRPTRRAAGPLVTGLLVGAAAIAGGLLVGAPALGQAGIAGYLSGRPIDASGDIFTRIAEVPQGWRFSDDLTWDFHRAAYGVGLDDPDAATPPPWLDRDEAAATLLHPWPRVDGQATAGLAVLAGLGAVLAVGWLVGDQRRQRAILAAAAFAAALGLGTVLALVGAESFAGREMVARRLLPFGHLVPVVAATVGLWLIGRRLTRRWARPGNRAAAPATVAVLAVAAALLAAPADVPMAVAPDGWEPGQPYAPSPVARAAYAWMAANLPDDARLLVAAYTPGTIAALTNRAGIVDGPAFLPSDPAWPAQPALRLLGARRLFLEPAGPGAAAYIEREVVDHVLVLGPSGLPADLGGFAPFEVDLDGLRASERFRLLREFGDGRLLLFEVAGF